MGLKNIVSIEVTLTPKDKCFMYSLICGSSSKALFVNNLKSEKQKGELRQRKIEGAVERGQ